MAITTLPTRGALDLQPALTDVRTPVANELSAYSIERVKTWIIDVVTEVGLTSGATVGSLRAAVIAAAAAAAAAVQTTRTISTTAPLTGGGDLSANRTFAISAASGGAAGSMSAADFAKLSGIEALADVTDDANVRAALAAATADIAVNSHKITGVTDPTSAQDAATKAYADRQRATIATNSSASITMADADSGKVIRCTQGAGPITVTVPSGLTAGTTVEYMQETVYGITVAGSGVTLRLNSAFNPATAGQWSSVVITILDTDEALVRGDLDPV